MSKLILFILTLNLLLLSNAEARKFDFKSNWLASSIGGSWGPSQLGDKGYADSSGPQTFFNQKVESNFSGDFSVLMALGRMNIRLGAELLIPRTLSELQGTNAAGSPYFQVKSSVFSVIPEINIEFVLLQTMNAKVFAGVGGGYAFTTLKNQYTFTALGNSQYPGIGDYTESSSSADPMYQGLIGFEVLMSDNVTFTMDGGYRYLPVRGLKYNTDNNGLDAHSHKAGDTVINDDGTQRLLNLSGGFAAISFRFYLL